MASDVSRSTGAPVVAVAACAVLLTAVLLAGVLTPSANKAGVGVPTGLASSSVASVPPAVHADLKEARADLAKLDTAIAGEEKQQEAAKAELATLEKDVKDNTLPESARTTVGPSGSDDVAAAIARLFGSHGREYAALAAQVAAFHEAFVQTLAAAGSAYQAAESATPTP